MRKFIVIIGAVILVGCSGLFGPTLDDPVVREVLAVCNDVPLNEWDNCMKEELDKRPDSGDITVGDILDLLDTVRPEPE